MKPLFRDSSGAIMVMGLFMAIFMVGILYYLIGMGEALFYRERMQDAADSAAFASAAIHARGMNFIALCNIIMAVLVAIMLGIGFIKNLLQKITLVAVVMAIFNPAFAPVPVKAGKMYYKAEKWYKKASNIITPILPVIRFAADGIKVGFPLAASAQAISVAFKKYNPPARAGVVWPIIKSLPVEDDDFKVTCDHAKGYLKDVVLYPFPDGAIKTVAEIAFEALNGLLNLGATTYCDSSSTRPAVQYEEEKRPVPPLGPKNEKCQSMEEMDENTRDAVCDEAVEEATKAVDMDPKTGECRTEECRERREKAVEQCDYKKNNRLSEFAWVEQVFVRTIRKTKLQGVVDETVAEGAPQIRKQADGHGIPCEVEPSKLFEWSVGGGSMPAEAITPAKITLSKNDITRLRLPWTRPKEGGSSGYTSEIVSQHVCYQSYDLPPKSELGKDPIEIRYRAVTSIISCVETFKKEYKFDKKLGADPEGASRSPKRMVKDAILGEEKFQIRAFVLGQGLSKLPDRVVKLASWGRPVPPAFGGANKALGILKHGSMAQAEFFYDNPPDNAAWVNADGDNSEWTWHMFWKARFRRFRVLPVQSNDGQCVADQGSGDGGLCGGGSGGDSVINNIAGAVNGIIMH